MIGHEQGSYHKGIDFQNFKKRRCWRPKCNKIETRVELFFDIQCSEGLSAVEKKRLFLKLKAKLIKGTLIRVVSQESRSQLTNKEIAIDKLLGLIIENIKVQKRRRATKVPYSKIQKRLADKKSKSNIKQNRGRIDPTDH